MTNPMTTDAIERDIDIDAPIEVVWRTITEPDLIRTWFSDVAEIEARPGAVGSLTFRAASDDPFVVGITVVDAEPPHRFSYRWVYPPGEHATETNSTLVTFTLTAAGAERTKLSVVESGLERMEMTDEDLQKFAEEHRHGWLVQGDRLRALFVAGSASPP